MAREMKVRPSELIGLEADDLTVYCFDRAINTFGEALLAELKDVEAKTKKEAQGKTRKILMKWLPEARPGRPNSGTTRR